MAVHHFHGFELHEELRQLRLNGREVALQPRAFDVLVYLVNNRSRVVDKDELLESLWPGVIVTDSSLQRAVSLARAALRSGGLDNAIRTYSKRGYRFMPELAPQPSGTSAQASADPALAARRLFELGSWAEAAQAFELADENAPLPPQELENWGVALQCAGAVPSAIEPFERAAEAYCDAEQCEAAARAVICLARLRFETKEWAVAKGCLGRAETMLEDLPLCEQHGHLTWIRSWLASYEGEVAATIRYARETVDIARRLDNLDLEAMGLLFWGIALQAGGDTQGGLKLQDQAGAVVLTGNVSPLLGGLVYCGLLGGCCNTGDWLRAGQWSESFTRWCRRNGVRRFSGSCILHRVEVFIARGELDRAEAEIRDNDETIKMSSASVFADASRFFATCICSGANSTRRKSPTAPPTSTAATRIPATPCSCIDAASPKPLSAPCNAPAMTVSTGRLWKGGLCIWRSPPSSRPSPATRTPPGSSSVSSKKSPSRGPSAPCAPTCCALAGRPPSPAGTADKP